MLGQNHEGDNFLSGLRLLYFVGILSGMHGIQWGKVHLLVIPIVHGVRDVCPGCGRKVEVVASTDFAL